MTTYLLFAWDEFYPGGGMADCEGVSVAESDDAAREWARTIDTSRLGYRELVAIDPEGTVKREWENDIIGARIVPE